MAKLNKIPDRNFILKEMYRKVINLKFKKADGEDREMNATLVTRLIDPRHIKESAPNPSDGDRNLIVCWDVDKKGWRSFKIDTIVEYNGVSGE